MNDINAECADQRGNVAEINHDRGDVAYLTNQPLKKKLVLLTQLNVCFTTSSSNIMGCHPRRVCSMNPNFKLVKHSHGRNT